MSKLTGKQGVLRILDGSYNLHGTAPRDDATPDVVTWDGATTWANITANVITDDTDYANNFIADQNGAVFVGSDVLFALIRFLKGGGANYAAGSGALIAYYFDGTDFSKELAGVIDGTASGGDCFAADGYIGFKIPSDWAIGADAVNGALDADKYYVKLMTTTASDPDPDADVLCPVDGQYFEAAFANMDFSGPIGRPRPEEVLVLERGQANSKMHFINKSEAAIYEPVPISFSCDLDDTYNKDDIQLALACGNPGTSRWSAAGTTTKGDTKNDGTNYNPALADSTKKCVNVQIVFTGAIKLGLAYYEVYFLPSEITVAEGEDGITLSASGGVYGLIEIIHGFGNRY